MAVAFGLFRLWTRTVRARIEDPHRVLPASRERPFIFSVWHNRLIILPSVLSRCFPHRRGVALISASRDGNYVATLVEHFGGGTVRGSSSRKGVVALRQLVDALAGGKYVVITPDGPRGPVYQVSPGIVYAAQKSGVPVVPIHVEYSGAWRLKSWDRFFVPKPFSKVRVLFGRPLQLAATTSPEEFERERLRIQDAMMEPLEEK